MWHCHRQASLQITACPELLLHQPQVPALLSSGTHWSRGLKHRWIESLHTLCSSPVLQTALDQKRSDAWRHGQKWSRAALCTDQNKVRQRHAHTHCFFQKTISILFMLWLIILPYIMPFNSLLFQVISTAAVLPHRTSTRYHPMYTAAQCVILSQSHWEIMSASVDFCKLSLAYSPLLMLRCLHTHLLAALILSCI